MRQLCVLLSIALLPIFGCTDSSSNSKPKPNPSNTEPIVGGFSEDDKGSASVASVAEFAVAEVSKLGPKLTLISVDSAQTQVVAGTNYRLILTVDDAGTKKSLEVLVYEDLKQVRSLTAQNWK